MIKRKNYRFRCPVCGLLVWESRLKNSYPLELVDVKSNGRGLIRNLFFDWDTSNSLHYMFEKRFYGVLQYLLERRYIDAKAVKDIVGLFEGVEYLRPTHVHVPVHTHHPLHVHEAKRR